MFFLLSNISKIGYINDSTAVYRTVPTGSARSGSINSEQYINVRTSYVYMRKYLLTNLITQKHDYIRAYHREYLSLLASMIISGDKNQFYRILNSTKSMEKNLVFSKLAYCEQRYVFNVFTVGLFRVYQKTMNLLYIAVRPKFACDTLKRKLLRNWS